MLANDLNTCTCCVRVCIVCEFSNLNGQIMIIMVILIISMYVHIMQIHCSWLGRK